MKQVTLFKYRGDTICVFPTLNHLAHGNQTGSFCLNKGFLLRSPCCFSTFLLKNLTFRPHTRLLTQINDSCWTFAELQQASGNGEEEKGEIMPWNHLVDP